MFNPLSWVEGKVFLTILRHVIAAAAAWLAAWGAAHGAPLDTAQLTAFMLAVYAAVEKLLKPATRALGEVQPGEAPAAAK